LTPEQVRTRALEVLVSIVGAMTEHNPVLVLAEDLHWVDPSTEVWLSKILEQVASWKSFVVITARPEYEMPWHKPAHMTELTLNNLSRRDCEQLVQIVAANRELSADMVAEIVKKGGRDPIVRRGADENCHRVNWGAKWCARTTSRNASRFAHRTS